MPQVKTIAEVKKGEGVCLTHGDSELVLNIKQSKDHNYMDVKTPSGTYEVRKDMKVEWR